jgi:hypothetical protein
LLDTHYGESGGLLSALRHIAQITGALSHQGRDTSRNTIGHPDVFPASANAS